MSDELQRIVDYAVAKVRAQVLAAGGYCSLGHVHPCDCAGAMWAPRTFGTGDATWRYPVLSAAEAAAEECRRQAREITPDTPDADAPSPREVAFRAQLAAYRHIDPQRFRAAPPDGGALAELLGEVLDRLARLEAECADA